MTKKTFSLLLLFSLIILEAKAQDNAYVLHVSGQVLYYSSFGAKPRNVSPGMELDTKGKIRCKGAGSAKLLYKGGTANITGSKLRDLQDVVKTIAGNGKMSFTGRFFDFMEESIREGDSQEKLKTHHRKYMNKASGGIKGYAKQEYAIAPLLTSSGNLPLGIVDFRWRDVNRGEGAYTFRLESASGATIAQLMTYDTSISLNISALAVKKGNDYKWSVIQANGSGKSVSVPVIFVPSMLESVSGEIKNQKAYQQADALEQQLMLAYGLEEAGGYYEAARLYAKIHADHPQDLLVRKVYASFLARLDMLQEANSLISINAR